MAASSEKIHFTRSTGNGQSVISWGSFLKVTGSRRQSSPFLREIPVNLPRRSEDRFLKGKGSTGPFPDTGSEVQNLLRGEMVLPHHLLDPFRGG
jgi:hypothetical protein